MAKATRDDSVLFSLQELLKIEQDRVQEEQAAKVRAEAEAQRRAEDERARVRAEQEARVRAAEEQRRAEEKARLDAEDRRRREREEAELRIRLDQEQRTRELQQERLLAHERELAQLVVARQADRGTRGGLYAMIAAAVLCVGGGAGYFGVFVPAQQRAAREHTEALRRLQDAQAEANRLQERAIASAAAARNAPPIVPVASAAPVPVVSAAPSSAPVRPVRPRPQPARPRPSADPFGTDIPGIDRL